MPINLADRSGGRARSRGGARGSGRQGRARAGNGTTPRPRRWGRRSSSFSRVSGSIKCGRSSSRTRISPNPGFVTRRVANPDWRVIQKPPTRIRTSCRSPSSPSGRAPGTTQPIRDVRGAPFNAAPGKRCSANTTDTMSSVVGKLVQLGASGEVARSFDVADKELVIGRCAPVPWGAEADETHAGIPSRAAPRTIRPVARWLTERAPNEPTLAGKTGATCTSSTPPSRAGTRRSRSRRAARCVFPLSRLHLGRTDRARRHDARTPPPRAASTRVDPISRPARVVRAPPSRARPSSPPCPLRARARTS